MRRRKLQAVRAATIHEPPVLRVLPDSEKRLHYFASLHHASFQFGSAIAILRVGWMFELPLINAMHKIDVPHEAADKMAENDQFFLNQKLLPIISYKPDVPLIRQNGVKLFMAVGKWTLEHKKVYGRTAPLLGEMLGCELILFPGHHVSYVDMPKDWSAVLRSILRKASE
jgi:hypothetical protein